MHMGGAGGYRHTCKGLFTGFINQLPKLDPNNPDYAEDMRFRQGTTPDFMLDATSINLPGIFSKIIGNRTFADMKTLAPRTAYSESASTAFSHSA